MKLLRPFFLFYGGKWRVAKTYPEPLYDSIIEPFAGAAGYSMRHYRKQIILNDIDPVLSGLWRYLISAEPERIRSLPILSNEQTIDDFSNLLDAEKHLIGFWLNAGVASPCKRPSKWTRDGHRRGWDPVIRERVATQVPFIRHWKVVNGSYSELNNIKATWFIDPPYQIAGKAYKFNSTQIDFEHLGKWCRGRDGQVVVCENSGASWLPFSFHSTYRGTKYKSTNEAIWTKGI